MAFAAVETGRRRRRQRQHAPTLREVAERAGVSTASASRALARPALVSADVHSKVLDAASALAYVPNASARALSSSRAELAGMVLPSDANPLTLRALRAFERDLGAADVGVLVAISSKARSAADCAHWLESRGAAAIALFGAMDTVGPVEVKHPCWAIVDLGFDRAVELAARYLHDLGHRRLCLVDEPAMGRSVQLLFALSDLVEVRIDSYDFRSVHPKEFGRQVVERWMALGADAPSALVCSSDLVGASVLRACLDHAIGVPRDVSLVAVGESGVATLTQPALTSIRIAAEDAGAAAARTILALLGDRTAVEARPGVKLVLRESCAAPR
ncbi:MAG: LacI family transcriptional regulator [Betaproteobacteria bacterium]|nr:MAG: LacI family transcriptional regulator [Betaproteobacteria bacterium]